MKTICFFNSTKAWGGGEKWHFDACTHLHGEGYPVLAIVHAKGALYKRLLKTDVRCLGFSVGNLSFLNPIRIKKLQKILTENSVDTIVMNLSRDLKLAGLASKRAGLQRVIYRRGSAIPIKNSVLNRYYFKNVVTEVLANSQATKATVLEHNRHLFPKDKIKVIYNGIAIEDFLKRPIHPLYKKKEEEEIVLVNLGRLEFQKNQKFLIELAAELKRRKLNFKIVIGGDGRLKEELQAMAEDLEVGNQVLFTGFVENPKDLICSGDIFVLSSLWEGFGYVLAEASLCKRPILAFDVSSNPEVVVDGKTGFLLPVDDVEAFADKIQYLVAHPKKIKQMGEAGHAFVRQNFDSKSTQEKIQNYLVHG